MSKRTLTPEQWERKRAYMREYNILNRAKRLAYLKEKWANRDLEHTKNLRRKSRYGITKEQFDQMLAAQNGNCALCASKPAVDIDHCHDTGKIRGLLCRGCNVGLGQLGDSIDGLMRAISYLRKGMN